MVLLFVNLNFSDLDWVGNFWPKNKYHEAPHVLLYVLMSLGGSFTDVCYFFNLDYLNKITES